MCDRPPGATWGQSGGDSAEDYCLGTGAHGACNTPWWSG